MVRDHLDRFYAIPLENQQAMVDATLMGAMVQTAMEFSTNPNLGIYEQERFNAFVDYLDQAKEGPGKTMAAVWLNTSQLARQGDWKRMLEAMREVERGNIFPPQLYGPYFSFFMQALTQMKEQKAAVEAGLKWLDELIMKAAGEDIVSYQTRAMMNAGKAALWQALGKSAEMKKAQKEMEKYVNLLKEGTAANVPNPTVQSQVQTPASLGKEVVLSYEFRQGAPVVKVVINGHTYYFLFDTCAGITCVSDKLVNTEKLVYRQTGQSMQGMDGQVVMAEIPELSLGELMVKDKQAAVMSEHNPIFVHLGVDRTIGANIINDYVVRQSRSQDGRMLLSHDGINWNFGIMSRCFPSRCKEKAKFTMYRHCLTRVTEREPSDCPRWRDSSNGRKRGLSVTWRKELVLSVQWWAAW